jgi:CheY-like chemotaxis protein
MPVKSGWDILAELKSDIDLATIPVVMLTMLEEPEMGYALGACEYLIKPISRDNLVRVLNKYHVSKQSVMVVDDDPSVRELTKSIAERAGHRVILAEDGAAALGLLETNIPGVILLDLMMPRMDGFEFLNRIRAQERYRHLPVVVMTAKDLTTEERAMLTAEASVVLQKGAIGREAILGAIQNHLG